MRVGSQPDCHLRIGSVQLRLTASNQGASTLLQAPTGFGAVITVHRIHAESRKGLEDRALADIVVGHSANEVYVVATNGDAWLSTDAGEHWQSLAAT